MPRQDNRPLQWGAAKSFFILARGSHSLVPGPHAGHNRGVSIQRAILAANHDFRGLQGIMAGLKKSLLPSSELTANTNARVSQDHIDSFRTEHGSKIRGAGHWFGRAAVSDDGSSG